MRPDLADGVFTDTNLSDEELKKIFGWAGQIRRND